MATFVEHKLSHNSTRIDFPNTPAGRVRRDTRHSVRAAKRVWLEI